MKAGLIKLIKEDDNYFGLPNLLSISRLMILPLIIYFLSKGTKSGDLFAFLFILISGLTDFFDGYFARKFNQRSQLGRVLDPVVDKINVGVIMLFLAQSRGLPYWYACAVIGRDIVIMIASLRIISKKRIISESNFLGKITLTSFVIVILLFVLNLSPYNKVVMWISAVLIPSSLIKYSVIYKALMGRNRENVPKQKETALIDNEL